MPRTENQKVVTGYLTLELYDKLEQFKLEEGLKSDSKAITTILERWFFGEIPIPAIAKTNRLEERLNEVERICEKLVEQVVTLTTPTSALSDVPDIVPDTVPSDVPSDVPDTVLSDVPDTVLSDVPDTVLSDVPDTVLSDVPDTVPSDVPDTVLSDVPDTVLSDVLSDVPDTVLSDVLSDVPDTVLSDVLTSNLVSTSLSQAELEKFVICCIDKGIGRFQYWGGFERGFVSLLDYANKYKSSGTLERSMKKILDDRDYAYIKQEPQRFELKYNPVRYFVNNPAPKSKERASV